MGVLWAKQRAAAAVEVQARQQTVHVSGGLETLLRRRRPTLPLRRMRQVDFKSPASHLSSGLHNPEDAAHKWHALVHTRQLRTVTCYPWRYGNLEEDHIRTLHRTLTPWHYRTLVAFRLKAKATAVSTTYQGYPLVQCQTTITNPWIFHPPTMDSQGTTDVVPNSPVANAPDAGQVPKPPFQKSYNG